MLNYFLPSAEEYGKHAERLMPVPRGESVKYSLARKDPTYFVINQIGLRPYSWQAHMLDMLANGKNVMTCSARQVGKTAAIAWYCLWACCYNTMPLETTKKTRVIIVSATEEQSKKIISDIKEFMRIGDEHIYGITGKEQVDKKTGQTTRVGAVQNWFTEQIDKGKDAHNNTAAITFKNGCQIISLPPTERARGYTASILFIDEAAFILEEDIYESTLKNIVAKTGGRSCLTSTPNGNQGFFFKLFDPGDELPQHPYERIWLPYTSLYLDDPRLVERRDSDRATALALGNERQFEQEHMASFNSATASFFDAADVDSCVSAELDLQDKSPKPCDLAVDFGANKVSRTVITISALEWEGTSRERIRLLYQREYPANDHTSLMQDIVELMTRFPIQRIIFEDCPAAAPFTQDAQKRGWNLTLFNPSSEKAPKYFALKHWMRKNKVKIPFVGELIRQMKGLVQEEGARTTKIHHGAGLLDDRIDSFMMSTYHFTVERSSWRHWDVDEVD
jgi:hypothetical protein